MIYNKIDRSWKLAKGGSTPAKDEVNITGVCLRRTANGGNAFTVMSIGGGISEPAMRDLLVTGIARLE